MNDNMQRGHAAVKAQNIEAAVQYFEQAWKESPEDPLAQAWLGQSLCSMGQNKQGLAHLRQAGMQLIQTSVASKNINVILEIAAQLQHWGDFQAALELLSQAIKINDSEFRCFQLIAATYAQLNKKKEALLAGEKALKLEPDNKMMQVFLATLETDNGLNDAAKVRLEHVLTLQLNAREAFRAHKELARVLDKLGHYESVFKHLQASAELSNYLPEYSKQNLNLVPNMLKANTQGYNRALMGRWSASQFPRDQPAPIFLLGFMRSGTTLTQEVLDAHPKVMVADETDFIWAMQNELQRMDSCNSSTAEKLQNLDLKGVMHLREFYWARVRSRFGDALYQRIFEDKFTMNTLDIGIINCIFPDAKIIFVMRDPRDVCLSCFMQQMAPTATTAHLLNWKGTAKFYAEVMTWWMYIKKEMTVSFIEFRYEDAIAEFEVTFRKIFDFVGVDWDPAVIHFHQHAAEKHITTPSRTQVSQPLYASSVYRWQQYETEFSAVAKILAPFISAFSYLAHRDIVIKPKWDLSNFNSKSN